MPPPREFEITKTVRMHRWMWQQVQGIRTTLRLPSDNAAARKVMEAGLQAVQRELARKRK